MDLRQEGLILTRTEARRVTNALCAAAVLENWTRPNGVGGEPDFEEREEVVSVATCTTPYRGDNLVDADTVLVRPAMHPRLLAAARLALTNRPAVIDELCTPEAVTGIIAESRPVAEATIGLVESLAITLESANRT